MFRTILRRWTAFNDMDPFFASTRRLFAIVMIIFFGLSALATPQEPSRFRHANSPYHFHFPNDHGSHNEFRTEWWYYTGHLMTNDGRDYGYELTFFRQAIDNPSVDSNPSRWAIHHLYLAHAALSDHRTQRFRYAEKISRAGIGKAGADPDQLHVWIDRWSAETVASDPPRHQLRAASEDFSFDLILEPQKKPIVHGEGGISRKGAEPWQASHYYSMTRLATTGTLTVNGRAQPVNGTSWMDHEFGSGNLGQDQVGWDWFSLQLEDRSELMFYLLRRADGTTDPVSNGTLIAENESTTALSSVEVRVEVISHWTSPFSGARYPSEWRLSIPSRNLSLHLVPKMPNQELMTGRSTQVTYWEGAVKVSGQRGEKPVAGQGYVELTGYATPLQLNK